MVDVLLHSRRPATSLCLALVIVSSHRCVAKGGGQPDGGKQHGESYGKPDGRSYGKPTGNGRGTGKKGGVKTHGGKKGAAGKGAGKGVRGKGKGKGLTPVDPTVAANMAKHTPPTTNHPSG